jgi:hypothetical protein
MKLIPKICLIFLLAGNPRCVTAAEIFVNNVSGDDTRDGLKNASGAGNHGPLKSIARAVELAKPGDTIQLEPTDRDYDEEILFKDKGGEPGQPITLDGHGVTLDGSEPCPAGAWKKAGDKLWCMEGIASRNGLIVEDRIVLDRKLARELLPGQFCVEATQFDLSVLFFKLPKDRSVQDCAVEVVWADGKKVPLDPQKWRVGSSTTYKLQRLDRPQHVLLDGVEVPLPDPRERLAPGEWCMYGKDLYYYPPQGKEPPTMNIRRIVRGTGVSLAGKLGHVVIKNLNVRFVWNDAFNVHNEVRDASFFNCNARDCFDEGFSAHDACETVLDGAVFERCDNGVFNVNTSGWSVTRNLTVRECRAFGFGVAVVDSQSKHWLSNAVLENNPTPLTGRYLEADNVMVTSSSPASIPVAGPLVLRHVTVLGPSNTIEIVREGGTLEISDSVFLSSGEQKIVFKKPAEVSMQSAFWSPGTSVLLPKAKQPLPLTDWIRDLAGKARQSGPLDLSPSAVAKDSALLPKNVGYRKN